MAVIKQLDDHLANKIAAGEVVERPVNVVKELVENSIDAGSTRIAISIEDGGKLGITIIDNGKGMDKADAMLCFSRHATSKIRDDHDLFCIKTLGFRGEALPSIASISEFTLETCDGKASTKVVYQYGKCLEVSAGDREQGTTVRIEKLFQNVPARLKFLKTVNTEFASIQSFIEKASLCYPQISFSLDHDGKPIYRTSGNGNVPEIMARLYGVDVARNLIEVHASNDDFTIKGYTSKIGHTRASKKDMMIMVNQRVVKNQVAVDAIYQSYRKYLEDKRFPIVLLNIYIDPYLVDVNVHPAKLEVRFSKEEQLRKLVFEGISGALGNTDLTYEVTPKVEPPIKQQQKMSFELNNSNPTPLVQPKAMESYATYVAPVDDGVVTPPHLQVRPDTTANKSLAQPVLTSEIVVEAPIITNDMIQPKKVDVLEVKGQIHGTYIICQDSDHMYLIDQHAAQERIFFEYYSRQYDAVDMRYTDLLVPIMLNYPSSEILLINDQNEKLQSVGITLTPHGDSGYTVRKIPVWMNNIDEKLFIESMIEQVLKNKDINLEELRTNAIATLSCKASIKGNSYHTPQALQGLVDKLMLCKNPYVCPHGRPSIIKYSSYELEKLFKRVV